MTAADIVAVAVVLFIFAGTAVLAIHRLVWAYLTWREKDELERMYRAPSAKSRWL